MNSGEINPKPYQYANPEQHVLLAQLAGMISPESRPITQLPFPGHDSACQLRSCGETQNLFLLCLRPLEQNDVLNLLGALSLLPNGRETKSKGPETQAHIFAPQFFESFTSKLPFLKMRCRLYGISTSRHGERDIVLIKNFEETKLAEVESRILAPAVMPEPAVFASTPLSAQELSEFGQLDTELKKLRASA